MPPVNIILILKDYGFTIIMSFAFLFFFIKISPLINNRLEIVLSYVKSIFFANQLSVQNPHKINSVEYNGIIAQYKKIPKDTCDRTKFETAIAKKITEEKGSFSVSDVLKKIDELYSGSLGRQERIDLYEDVKRWTSHGDLCTIDKEEHSVKYFKFK
ncbi:MAG: hypothetical protein V1859_02200 [archaeon]